MIIIWAVVIALLVWNILLTLEMRVLWSVVIYIGKVTGANPPRNGDE